MNKKTILKQTTAAVLCACMLTSAAYTANAAVSDKTTARAVIYSEYTDTYKSYLSGTVTVDENSGVSIAPYETTGTTLTSSSLPSSYTSSHTDIRDQGSYNTCWAFAAIATLEAYLATDGKGEQDLSEQHLSWWTTTTYNSDGVGWLMDGLSAGGYSMAAPGYLISWQGAKSESDVPYYTSGNSTLPSNMDTAENTYNTTGIIYIENDIDTVKTAVYTYGAVETSYNSGGFYSNNYTSYYQPTPTNNFSGHAISIVGWDDNYSASNFSVTAPADGAWLVKNSWGTEVGDDGYLWISYYDKYILDSDIWGSNYAITDARTSSGYDKLYQNEEYGATWTMAVETGSTPRGTTYSSEVTYINQFTFDSEHDILESVIFENESIGASYTVYYIPVENGKPTTNTSAWTELASGTTQHSGYIEVSAGAYSLPSGQGAIGVTIDTSSTGDAATIGVGEWLSVSETEYVFMPDMNVGESYSYTYGLLYDAVDLYADNDDTIGGTLVIKALTTSNLIGDADLNSTINSVDALMVLRYSAGLPSLQDDDAIINADVNFDGIINSVDALMILCKSAALINSF